LFIFDIGVTFTGGKHNLNILATFCERKIETREKQAV